MFVVDGYDTVKKMCVRMQLRSPFGEISPRGGSPSSGEQRGDFDDAVTSIQAIHAGIITHSLGRGACCGVHVPAESS